MVPQNTGESQRSLRCSLKGCISARGELSQTFGEGGKQFTFCYFYKKLECLLHYEQICLD